MRSIEGQIFHSGKLISMFIYLRWEKTFKALRNDSGILDFHIQLLSDEHIGGRQRWPEYSSIGSTCYATVRPP